jgi:hypothetical protein
MEGLWRVVFRLGDNLEGISDSRDWQKSRRKGFQTVRTSAMKSEGRKIITEGVRKVKLSLTCVRNLYSRAALDGIKGHVVQHCQEVAVLSGW